MESTLTESERHTLLAEIGRLVRARQSAPTTPAGIGFAQLGDYLEVRPGNTEASTGIIERFAILRAGMYRHGRGTWLQARYVLSPDGSFDFDFYSDVDPSWITPPPSSVYRDELATFPREDAYIPDWWRLRVGLPLAFEFRHARPATALMQRPALSPEERPLVLQYLEREAEVGAGHRTDGTWIWPAEVAGQLRRRGIPPEPAFLTHMREQGFQPPHVAPLLRRTAKADLTGRPRPRSEPAELAPTAADLAAELETDPEPELTDGQLLAQLENRLDALGVWPRAYRIGTPEPGAWSLYRGGSGWLVTAPDGAAQQFPDLASAAQQMLGALLLYPARATGGRETPLETAKEVGDWPIQPTPGDPPLTLLRNKRLTRLGTGTVVLRFGEEPGNLVHQQEVRFATTSLPLERERVTTTFRLRRSLYVITGVTVPWANLPGGAVAYVLPKPIAEHESDGSLERIE